jgi:shikimate kinase
VPRVVGLLGTLARVLVYITGVPGCGKSTACEELHARGYVSVDADDQIGVWVSRDSGHTLTDAPAFAARTPTFYEQHLWRYRAEKAAQLGVRYRETVCFIGGFAAGEDEISHLFAKTFFLSVGANELRRRLMSRTNGPFADASAAVRAAQVERVLPRQAGVEQAWLAKGFERVSSTRPVAVVVENILTRCGLPLRAE